MDSRKILIVEDDRNLLDVLQYNLVREGYTVETAEDGLQALDVARSRYPELIILDVMLPRLNGFEVCRILRKETSIPILMLTARDDEVDKVVGLEFGADDYVTKPFSMPELLACVRVMLRRAKAEVQTGTPESEILRLSNLDIDPARRCVTVNGTLLVLTPKVFDLLLFLARNLGLVFSRAQLLEKVWGYDYAGDTRTVDVHVRWLRAKIEDDSRKPKRLITVRGVGYKLDG